MKTLLTAVVLTILSTVCFAGDYTFQDLQHDVNLSSLQEVEPTTWYNYHDFTGGTYMVETHVMYVGDAERDLNKAGLSTGVLYEGNLTDNLGANYTELFVFLTDPHRGGEPTLIGYKDSPFDPGVCGFGHRIVYFESVIEDPSGLAFSSGMTIDQGSVFGLPLIRFELQIN